MMRWPARVMIPLLGILAMNVHLAGASAAEPQTLLLWPEGAPGAQGKESGNENNPGDVPTITIFKPEHPNGASVVICPGGGYGFLATDHEGKQVAEWLNSLGVTGVLLKYRLAPRYKHPIMLHDAQRALRTVRARASEWGLDPKRVGVMGFSAGGHLASTAGTHFDAGKADAADPIDRVSCRPDILILGYPVVALATEHAHGGSRDNLLGKNPDKELLLSLSNETQVTKETPPTFLVHTNADSGVVPENSLLFALALRKAGVPLELHIFEKGQHGLGLGNGAPKFNVQPDPAFKVWPSLCAEWLRNQGFVAR